HNLELIITFTRWYHLFPTGGSFMKRLVMSLVLSLVISLPGFATTQHHHSHHRTSTTSARTKKRAQVRTKPTAVCTDGTYSYSAHHRGTCSHHGGVKTWNQ